LVVAGDETTEAMAAKALYRLATNGGYWLRRR